MAISMTFHGETTKAGEVTLDGQLGDAVPVANGTVSAAVTRTGIYRVVATSASVVRFGPDDLADATGGEVWPIGTVEYRRVIKGQVVAVDAGA